MSGSSEGKPVPRTLVLDLVDGVLVPPKSFRREVVRDGLRYVARPGDIFLATYPKTGATWTQYTLWCLMNLGEEGTGKEITTLPSFADIMTKCVPFLELVGREVAENTPEPRIIKHHLSFQRRPPYHRDAKYVVIVRQPFDCVVSYYHHCMGDRVKPRNARRHHFRRVLRRTSWTATCPSATTSSISSPGTPTETTPTSSSSTTNTSSANPAQTVLALAKFVDKKIWGRLRADEALLNQFLERTSFANLKSSVSIKGDVHAVSEHKAEGEGKGHNHADDKENGPAHEDSAEAQAPLSNFFRKGQVGDWRRHFKPEQKRRLRDVYDRRMRGTEMWDVWEEYLDLRAPGATVRSLDVYLVARKMCACPQEYVKIKIYWFVSSWGSG
ncbi:hypothetical protein HPB48_014486 [Haemaphysalis longicornis]|uniref:Sulfotransferase domain-containing protein n=1 Tax=Haemaphysalis longicornis TaxID=44386 RepID=A0A9J6GND2_HAELO|nr:hypothetical protein HPB48_014486 [Haemaphysalis longicornis]